MFAVVKMASSESSFISEHSQAYIFRKQEFKVSQIIEILYKSKNWVIKWSVKLENLAGEREVVGQLICVLVNNKR